MKGKLEVRDVLLASLAVATIIATIRGTALPVIPPSLIVEHSAPALPPSTPRQPAELELRAEPIRMTEVIGDKCSGKDCQVVSITTRPIAVANLPSCNASSRAMVRATTNGGADGGFGYMDCDGSSWRALGSGAGGATEELTVTPPLSIYDDGGVVNIAIAIEQFPDVARDVANITAGRTVTYSLAGLTTVFEAGDSCVVGFALNGTGGLAGTLWECWPNDTNSIGVRVGCLAAADCDPASQTIFYTVTCPDGSCH